MSAPDPIPMTADAPSTEPSTRPSAEAPRWPHIALACVLAAAVVGETWLWVLFEPAQGESIKNLVTYSVCTLVLFLVVLWTAFYAPAPRRIRIAGVALLLLPVVGYAATVRSVDFSGDMRLVIQHRWDPLPPPPPPPVAPPPLPENVSLAAAPEDMPMYRGWNSEGVVQGPPLSQDWESSPPEALWRHACGGGYSQFAVLEPFLISLEQRDEQEAVVCYDTRNGGERWRHEYAARFDEAMGGPGPRSTPVISDGAVYALGALGDLTKLFLLDGKVAWHANILEQHQARNTEWAVTSSPLIVDNLVIANPGGPEGDGLAAYDKETGKLAWGRAGLAKNGPQASRNRPGYSSPMIAELLGTRQIVMFDGTGLRGYVPETGKLLWEHKHENGPGVNVAQPIVFEDGRVFISASYETGCAMLQIKRSGEDWSVEPLWANAELRCKFTSPVLHDGYIYGLDEGILTCIDPANGKRRWKGGRYGHGQVLLTNGQLLVHTEDGRAVLVQLDPKKFREITSFKTLADGRNWNAPALVRGRLYVRNHAEMAAFDLASRGRESPDGSLSQTTSVSE